MNCITLKDNTFLYSQETLQEYLENLGFNIEDLTNILCMDLVKENSLLKDAADEQEMIADGLQCNMTAAYNELESIANDLSLGKGGTKAKMADKIKYVLDCYMNF